MQTAKTVLLLDTSGNYISPATNIESLYYEVIDNANNIVYRHSAYQHFPTYVNYGNTIHYDYKPAVDSDYSILDISTDKLTVKCDGKDIILSSISNRKIDGTNYYALDVSNYNLSEMLMSYMGVRYAENRWKEIIGNLDVSLADLKQYIDNTHAEIDASIDELYNFVYVHVDASIKEADVAINRLEQTLYGVATVTRSELLDYINNKLLLPGRAYRMIYDPTEEHAGWDDHGFYMYLFADSSSDIRQKVEMCEKFDDDTYFTDEDNLKTWEVIYDITTNNILRMIDNNGNSAPVDFKNMRYNDNYYLFTYVTNAGVICEATVANVNGNITSSNNVIDSSDNIYFIVKDGTNISLKNNYIGVNCQNIEFVFNKACNGNVFKNNNSYIYVYAKTIIGNMVGCNNTQCFFENYQDTESHRSRNINMLALCNNKLGNANDNISLCNETIELTGGGIVYLDVSINSNNVSNNCSMIKLFNIDNIIEHSCFNVSLKGKDNLCMAYSLNIAISGNCNIVSTKCKDITILNNAGLVDNVFVGPELINININDSNRYITSQRIWTRSVNSN